MCQSRLIHLLLDEYLLLLLMLQVHWLYLTSWSWYPSSNELLLRHHLMHHLLLRLLLSELVLTHIILLLGNCHCHLLLLLLLVHHHLIVDGWPILKTLVDFIVGLILLSSGVILN
jgi:hypothetical protein